MKKLKNILQYNVFTILVVCVVLLYVLYSCKKKLELPSSDHVELIGIVESIKYENNKVQLQIRGKDKILANYYLNEAVPDEFNNVKIGNKVYISGKVKIPSSNTNFNTFNYQKYLLSKKIKYTLDIDIVNVVNRKQNIFYKIKSSIENRLSKSQSESYLKAFILGDTSYLDLLVKQSFLSNGISHLFSVSGMHVGFLSSIILFILNKINKRDTINRIILFLFLMLYAFLTGFSPSIMRSVIFMIVLFVSQKLNLPYSSFKLFILMTSFFLLYNPYYIYNIGFIYSFLISGFLIFFADRLKNKNYLYKLFIVSVIAFLASFPISLLNNFEINFISPLLNLFFVPLVSIVVFPLSFLVALLPCLTTIYVFLIKILEDVSLWCCNNISLVVILGKPHLLAVVSYYFIFILILKFPKNKIGYIIFIVILIIHFNIRLLLFYPRLTMLDVGQGDSILLELPRNRGNILIDTGGVMNSNYSLSKNTIIPYLKSLGIRKLNYLILTHGDYDHMGEAINLVNNFKVEKVIFNCGNFNQLELELTKVLNDKKIKYDSCIKELNIDNNKLYFLQTKEYDNENDNSNVIYTELNGYKFMFMGDAGVEKEKDILNKYNISNISVLKVGHHGSKTSSGESFIDEINPKYSMISVGKNNRYGHPNKEVLENLNESKIYRTDENGSIMFKIKNNKLKIETCTP